MEAGEWHHWKLVRITENNITVKIAALVRGRRVLVGGKGGEASWFVVQVGSGYGIFPGVFCNVIEYRGIGFATNDALDCLG